ncbi:NAD(P)H-dependent oxidoreductase [Bdellovibrionota bacterium FG-1]
MSLRIAVLVGSLRKESFNKKIAKQLMLLAPKALHMDALEIGQLPLYNQDLDDEERPPAEWVEFRSRLKKFDGLLFVTPEYNRSVPAVLKNALDVGSRPYGQSVWDGKPAAVVSVSPGAIGGFGANHHFRQSLVFLNVPCLQQPEMYIGNVEKQLDSSGNITNEKTRQILENFIHAFADWVSLFSAKSEIKKAG